MGGALLVLLQEFTQRLTASLWLQQKMQYLPAEQWELLQLFRDQNWKSC